MGEGGQRYSCFSSLFLSSFSWQIRRTGVEIPTNYTVSIYTFVYWISGFLWQVSLFFFHHLILKLERKGIEGWIANIRGFWKFPFYGTWVFLKNSSLSVVFLWFWWKSLCPATPLLSLSIIPTLFRARAWMEMVRGRITWFALPGRKEPHLDPF